MDKKPIEDLIRLFTGDYSIHPFYEFKMINPNAYGRSWLRYDYETGEFVPYDGEHSILFIEDSHSPLFIWLEHPYKENIIWSWARHGNWGANVSDHPGGNAWHRMIREGASDMGNRWGRDRHPNSYVVDYARKVHMTRGSSGAAVDFYICDPHIMRGLVRNYLTGEVLTFPDKFDCIYCGELDWKSEDRRWIDYQEEVK